MRVPDGTSPKVPGSAQYVGPDEKAFEAQISQLHPGVSLDDIERRFAIFDGHRLDQFFWITGSL